MNWAKYTDGQTKNVIEHPRAVTFTMLMFAFIAGERLTELLENHQRHAYDLIFTAMFIFFPIWWSYFVVQALRELRDRQSTSTVNEFDRKESREKTL